MFYFHDIKILLPFRKIKEMRLLLTMLPTQTISCQLIKSGLIRIEVIAALINISELYGFSYTVGRYGEKY